jgi:hypothetical protein
MSILSPRDEKCLTDFTLTRKTSSEHNERSYRKLTQVDGLKMLRR